MKLPRFEELPGPETLNGPILEGYAARTRVFAGEGVVMGADVLILATTPEIAEGVAAALGDLMGPAKHVRVAQPPWYQNTTKSVRSIL